MYTPRVLHTDTDTQTYTCARECRSPCARTHATRPHRGARELAARAAERAIQAAAAAACATHSSSPGLDAHKYLDRPGTRPQPDSSARWCRTHTLRAFLRAVLALHCRCRGTQWKIEPRRATHCLTFRRTCFFFFYNCLPGVAAVFFRFDAGTGVIMKFPSPGEKCRPRRRNASFRK